MDKYKATEFVGERVFRIIIEQERARERERERWRWRMKVRERFDSGESANAVYGIWMR